jgi:hypothetical protein
MAQVTKSPDGIFIPKELIADFDHVEVDTSHPHAIIIRSSAYKKELTTLLTRIDQRREAIQTRQGIIGDSSSLIQEDREREDPRALRD